MANADEKKQGVIDQLVEARKMILDAAATFSTEQQKIAFVGVWTINDLLAHLVGWDHANMEALTAIQAGQLPEFYAHHNREWDAFNAQLVAQHKGDNVLEQAHRSHQQLVALAESIPANRFDKDFAVRFKGYRVTILRTLQSEARDELKHYEQIQTFLEHKETS
jgi:hypothetical protein